MVTFKVKYTLAQTVVKQQRFTAVLLVTIVQFRTSMMVKHKSSKTEEFTILFTQATKKQKEQLTTLTVVLKKKKKLLLQ